jgi:hypothetical protein
MAETRGKVKAVYILPNVYMNCVDGTYNRSFFTFSLHGLNPLHRSISELTFETMNPIKHFVGFLIYGISLS